MLIVIQIIISQSWCPILYCYLRLIMLNNTFGESTFSKVVWRGFEKWVYGLSDLVVHVETSRHLREYCMPSACGTVRLHPSPPCINKPLTHFTALLAYYNRLQFRHEGRKHLGPLTMLLESNHKRRYSSLVSYSFSLWIDIMAQSSHLSEAIVCKMPNMRGLKYYFTGAW